MHRYRLLSAILVSIYAFYLRFARLLNRELWTDELYQYKCIKGPFKAFWQHHSYGDHTRFPGEYLLTYPFARIFGPNKWGLNIPHILLTILGFYFLYKICQKNLRTAWGVTITFLIVCFNANLIFHSFEYRPYGVLATLALGCLYFSDKIISRYDETSRTKKFFIGLFFVMAANYHAYGILIFFLPVIYNLVIHQKGPWKNIFSRAHFQYFFVVSLMVIPVWCWYASANFFGLAYSQEVHQTLTDPFAFIPNPLVDIIGFSKGIFGNLIGYKRFYVFLAGIPLTFILPLKRRLHLIFFFLILVVLPIEIIFLIDVRNSYWFIQRQFAWVAPFFAIYLGWSWESIVLFLRDRVESRKKAPLL